MDVNPLIFPTYHSSISLCFHRLHYATSNNPAFKSTLLSSCWSLQFIHWQTLHLSFVQSCGERSPRSVTPASGTFVHFLMIVVIFPVSDVCWSIVRAREETMQYLNRLWVSLLCLTFPGRCGSLLPSSVKIMWSWCIWWVILQHREILGCPPAMYFSVPFSHLQCPCSSQDRFYAKKII